MNPSTNRGVALTVDDNFFPSLFLPILMVRVPDWKTEWELTSRPLLHARCWIPYVHFCFCYKLVLLLLLLLFSRQRSQLLTAITVVMRLFGLSTAPLKENIAILVSGTAFFSLFLLHVHTKTSISALLHHFSQSNTISCTSILVSIVSRYIRRISISFVLYINKKRTFFLSTFKNPITLL
jgi:hypothetical protein